MTVLARKCVGPTFVRKISLFSIFIFLILFSTLLPVAWAVETPGWYNGHRVHVHTRLSIKSSWWDTPQFWGWAAEVDRMGVSVSTRFIKGAEEGAWWKSSVGAIHPYVYEMEAAGLPDGDIAAKIITDAHAAGVRQFAYYRHQDDEWAEVNHPDWRCYDREGNVIMTATRGAWMSIASPYGDYVITRIVELAQRGVDGIYFDYLHIPPEGDFNSYAQQKYAAWHGNADLLTSTEAEAKAFRQELVVDFFTRATAAFHAVNPEGVILMSANQCSLDSLRAADAPKYEDGYNANLGGADAAATILTDVGGGYPHLWRYTDDDLYTAARYIAFGAIYNRDVLEAEVYDVPEPLHPDYGEIFALGRSVSPAMADVQPYRYARVLVPGEMIIKDTNLGAEYSGAWSTLIQSRIPAGFSITRFRLCPPACATRIQS